MMNQRQEAVSGFRSSFIIHRFHREVLMSTSDGEVPFLAAIAAEPDEDTPRLIFADWLEEQGQLAHAEFLRIQCRLAQLDEYEPTRYELQDRQDALLRNHGTTWRGHPPEKVEVGFERGLLVAKTWATTLLDDPTAAAWWEAQRPWVT